MTNPPPTSRRFVHLECARGVAAIIVILHHFCLAFYPGLKESVRHSGLLDTPLYVLVNGAGAVVFFFALSGFVLTRSMFKNPSWQTLAVATVKRLPRLLVPAGISIILGFLILKYFPGTYVAAAAISHSEWLKNFANAVFPENFSPSLGDAFRQCIFVFLHHNDFYYNSNLWTMVVEFRGSLLVFFIAALYCFPRLGKPVIMIALHVAILMLCYVKAFNLVAFAGGSLLAYLNTNVWPEIKLSRSAVLGLLLVAIAGFSRPNEPFDTGAALVIMFVLVYEPSAKALMDGRLAIFLGHISFPIYLVSTLVILSISSALFVFLSAHAIDGTLRGLSVLLVTLTLSLLTCLPLVLIDRVWVKWLNKISATVLAACSPAKSDDKMLLKESSSA